MFFSEPHDAGGALATQDGRASPSTTHNDATLLFSRLTSCGALYLPLLHLISLEMNEAESTAAAVLLNAENAKGNWKHEQLGFAAKITSRTGVSDVI